MLIASYCCKYQVMAMHLDYLNAIPAITVLALVAFLLIKEVSATRAYPWVLGMTVLEIGIGLFLTGFQLWHGGCHSGDYSLGNTLFRRIVLEEVACVLAISLPTALFCGICLVILKRVKLREAETLVNRHVSPNGPTFPQSAGVKDGRKRRYLVWFALLGAVFPVILYLLLALLVSLFFKNLVGDTLLDKYSNVLSGSLVLRSVLNTLCLMLVCAIGALLFGGLFYNSRNEKAGANESKK